MTSEIVALDKKPISEYNQTDIAICKRYIKAEKASEQEWEKLVLLSTKYNLNPLCNEMWIIPGVGVTVGLAGMIKIAERSGQYDGMRTETTHDENGDLIHTCTVWRKDMAHPIVKSIRNNEFSRPGANGKLSNWDKMPVYMGEKVAEVHALKRAFSLMDLYIPEEFGLEDDRSGSAEPYQASFDGKPVTVEPLKTTTTVTQTPTKCGSGQASSKPQKCPICGKNEPMLPFEKDQVLIGFKNANIPYDLPDGACRECANRIYKEKALK